MPPASALKPEPISAQISAVKGVIGELRSGVSRINGEILTAAGVDGEESDAAAHEAFSRVMVDFQETATVQFAKLEARAQQSSCYPLDIGYSW